MDDKAEKHHPLGSLCQKGWNLQPTRTRTQEIIKTDGSLQLDQTCDGWGVTVWDFSKRVWDVTCFFFGWGGVFKPKNPNTSLE